jgi:predicted dehydrogenase
LTEPTLTETAGIERSSRRARVGIVGAGDRVRRVYLPTLKLLAEEIEVIGFMARTAATRKRFASETGLSPFDDVATMIGATRPDFLIVAVSPDQIDRLAPALVELRVSLLIETPFAWSMSRARGTLRRLRQLELVVGVAEQTPFLPAEQLKRMVLDIGLIGHVVAVHNDFAVYDYHGIAAARRLLGGGRRPQVVNAVRSVIDANARPAEIWVLGSVRYDDGALLVHHFSPRYFDNPVRGPRSLRVYGTEGSIVDNIVISEAGGRAAIEREVRDGRFVGMSVRMPAGDVRWVNPFASFPLSDEQIAVALLLRQMKSAALHHGYPAYSAADGLADMEILTAMRYSADRNGAPVALPLRDRLERLRAAAPGKVVRRVRLLAQRR